MIEHAPNTTTRNIAATSQAVSRADCESLIICLEGGRFVIAAVDNDPFPVLICEDKPDLRELAVGDTVDYRGDSCKVRAVEVFR
ncbi:hypothetical protein LF1_42400 [Rubripirellula obstinata]|uniref:Uncharacterized protein n=1 Tax=Rubripirellula obstinata TaxID=406547 RepID=A0A5B1CP01_9BACT|nr:hypothetical protein [Rubripirellula obstinata]KAA1261685.1 hypothetical protein LF1_42400 [Rubripirellula obstinata]